MNCVYSPYDIDYSDSQPSCITIGNITSCNLNVTHGTNTFYVICEDSNGNGQDYDENIKITFTAFVLEEINQIVNIDSIEPLTITYLNSTGNQFAQYSSNTQFNASVFTPYLYYVLIESQNGSFSGTVLDTNLSVTPELNISATYINISEISNNNTEVGNSSFRYVVRDAYGMQINSTHTGNYQITFNYTGVSVTNENALEIFEYEYDFNTNQIDYTKYTHHSSPTRNTNANLVTSTTNDFSVFVLVEDSQEQEICDDNIDNDGDGSTDEGCTVVSTSNSGGGGSSNDDDDDTPSRRGGGSGGPVISLKPTCTDKKMNQDESDIDCGGTNCDACNLSKSCSTHTDCSSGYCNVETLICEEATCFDNVLNQDEEEIDCGGETCEQCMRCDDGIKNYGELEIDCGGPCRSCATCFDNVKNQGEIDTDCGGPCKVCGTCYDFKKNNDEEDIDCGGSCDPCTPISEESPKDTQFPIISMIAAFLIIGGLAIIYAMKSMHKHEEIVPQVLIQEPIIEPKFAPIIHIPEIIEVTDDTILKLQRYVNYSLAMEKTKGEIFDYLKNLSWDEEVIDNLIKDAGDPTIIKDMLNMENYIANLYMMHVTSEKIKRELLKNGWDKILIDASMANIGLVSDKEKLDSFVHEELKSGKDSEEIIEFLKSIGWPKKILTKSIIDSQNRFKKDKNEIDKTIKRMVEKGKSIEKIKEKLEEMGFEEDFINHLLQNYSIERNIEVIKAYVNNELKKGILIGDIKDSLIKKGWAIDVINSVIESEFLMKDMSKLLELEKYMDAKFEKGETKEEVTKDLLKKKWADEYIDIVMLKVHIIDDKTDKIKQYVNIRLKKGDAKKKIEDILVSIGWSRRLIKDILENKI